MATFQIVFLVLLASTERAVSVLVTVPSSSRKMAQRTPRSLCHSNSSRLVARCLENLSTAVEINQRGNKLSEHPADNPKFWQVLISERKEKGTEREAEYPDDYDWDAASLYCNNTVVAQRVNDSDVSLDAHYT